MKNLIYTKPWTTDYKNQNANTMVKPQIEKAQSKTFIVNAGNS